MSGGSYNYLCNRQPGELLDCREDIESARHSLLALDAADVAQVLTDVLGIIGNYRPAVEAKMDSVYGVLHELEWWHSNDHSEEDFRAALAEHRAAQVANSRGDSPMADAAELANRFAFHAATTQERRDEHERVRDAAGDLAAKLNDWLPEGREKSLAFTHLEQVMFWANAGIARQGA
jgi:hypothetical protein